MSRVDLSDPAINQAFNDIKNPSSPTNWYVFFFIIILKKILYIRILLGYVPKSDIKLKVAGQGTGGFNELKDQFNDGKVLFALVSFDINKTKKFVYISWCGEGVIGMKKGLFNNHANDVAHFFRVKKFLKFIFYL